MSNSHFPPIPNTSLPSEILIQLQKKYDSSIHEKISILKNLITLAQKDPSTKNLKALQNAVHQLSGSAGLYGYLEVSIICKQFEQELFQIIKTKTHFFEKDYLDRITNAFQDILTHPLATKISSYQAKIATIGLGYTGLSLLEAFGIKGFPLIAYDYNKKKVENLQKGEASYNFTSLSHFSSWIRDNKCSISSDPSILEEADVIIICTSTSLDDHQIPDTNAIQSVFSTVSHYLKPGKLIILQSTIYPGATEDDLLPLLSKNHLTVGKDFFLAYVPEISDPGNPNYSLTTIPRIISGVTPSCLKMTGLLYQTIDCPIFFCSSTKIAEAAKLLQNTYRLINISFINEMKISFNQMGIDIWEVIEAASMKPFGFTPFYPSLGIGGECIPVVPAYLSWKAKEINGPTSLIDISMKINRLTPSYVVEKIGDALNTRKKNFKEAKILVLGIAYKKEVNDLRESASLTLISLLQKKLALVDYHDPYIKKIYSPRHYQDIKLTSIDFTPKTLSSYDAVIIATDHSFYNWNEIALYSNLIIDTRNVMAHIPSASGKTFKA